MYQESKYMRNHKIQKTSSKKEGGKSDIHLICIFPEKASDAEAVKSDVRNILTMELHHQLQQLG